MANETILNLVGNLTADPELRHTQQGTPVVNFTVASTPRTFDKESNSWVDGEALFMRCTAWRQLAENVSVSLKKGTRVTVSGVLQQKSYEKDGIKRTSFEMQVSEVGVSLAFDTVQIQPRQPRQQSQGWSQPVQPQGWAQPGYDTEAPF